MLIGGRVGWQGLEEVGTKPGCSDESGVWEVTWAHVFLLYGVGFVCTVKHFLCSFITYLWVLWYMEPQYPHMALKSTIRTWVLCLSFLETYSHPSSARYFASKYVLISP